MLFVTLIDKKQLNRFTDNSRQPKTAFHFRNKTNDGHNVQVLRDSFIKWLSTINMYSSYAPATKP